MERLGKSLSASAIEKPEWESFLRFLSMGRYETSSKEVGIISRQVEFVNEAKKEIVFCCSAEEINDPRLIEALSQAVSRGVKVRVVFPEEVEESLLEGIVGIERYRLVPVRPAQTHFMVADGKVMIEKLHLPDEQRECYFKEETYFLGAKLQERFVVLASKAVKF